MKMRFSRKLHIAFAAMLTITLALSWYFYNSVQWFEYDVERITIANSVLNGHRLLSAETGQKLNLIDESVTNGEIGDLLRWQDNVRILRATIIAIRHALEDERVLGGLESQTDDLDILNEMETLVESFIASGETVRTALTEQRFDDARVESQELHNSGLAQIFNELMNETLDVRSEQLREANAETISLARYITGVLPLFMLVLAGLTALIAWLFTHGLTRSVNALHDGVQAFTNDNLNHRIPELDESEFEELGNAFNAMARQLGEHRSGMRDSNIRLEAIVEERTRALKTSNEILEMADENRRKFLADISHEFRTPLTVIRGESEIALRGKAKTKEEYQETLARIMEQAEHTTRLVDDLLFIARADAGEPRLKVRPVSVSSLLSTACKDLAAKAIQADVSVEQNLEQDNAVVLGDAGRLRQVFSILIDNAIRYSRKDGKVEVNQVRNDKEIVVTVSDNGIGLTGEEARQAFQRFFRGSTAQGHARGTGLGLPVAKAIVEAHKGTITLEGRSGEGAVATVILPAEEKLKAVA